MYNYEFCKEEMIDLEQKIINNQFEKILNNQALT